MGSKALLFFCISLAIVLAITSQAAGRELAETFTSVNNPYGGNFGDPRGGGNGGNYGGWGYGESGGGPYGGYPDQAVDAEP